jgi:hypothetical protein
MRAGDDAGQPMPHALPPQHDDSDSITFSSVLSSPRG